MTNGASQSSKKSNSNDIIPQTFAKLQNIFTEADALRLIEDYNSSGAFAEKSPDEKSKIPPQTRAQEPAVPKHVDANLGQLEEGSSSSLFKRSINIDDLTLQAIREAGVSEKEVKRMQTLSKIRSWLMFFFAGSCWILAGHFGKNDAKVPAIFYGVLVILTIFLERFVLSKADAVRGGISSLQREFFWWTLEMNIILAMMIL
ncbi:uncharacterized protein BKA78DRAFT_324168 [Phyllosticta capitalensis]